MKDKPFLCKILLHKWKYNKDKNQRKCERCGKKQLLSFMLGDFDWIVEYDS